MGASPRLRVPVNLGPIFSQYGLHASSITSIQSLNAKELFAMVYLRSCMKVLDQVAIVLLQLAFLFSPRGLTIFDGRGKLCKNKVQTKE